MDIEDAFTTEAIQDAGVDVGDATENEIRAVIRQVCSASEVELTQDEESVAVLCFVAGRAYQYGHKPIDTTDRTQLVNRLLDYLEGE